jgi:hypothetical protein
MKQPNSIRIYKIGNKLTNSSLMNSHNKYLPSTFYIWDAPLHSMYMSIKNKAKLEKYLPCLSLYSQCGTEN